MTGRPTKLNPQTQQRICEAIQLGATYELAAAAGGVSYEALNIWRKRGMAELERRDGNVKEGTKQWIAEEPYVQFFHALQKAEADGALGWLAEIEQAAMNGNWQAAAWKLERRYPDSYGRKRIDTDLTSGGEKLQIRIEYDDRNPKTS